MPNFPTHLYIIAKPNHRKAPWQYAPSTRPHEARPTTSAPHIKKPARQINVERAIYAEINLRLLEVFGVHQLEFGFESLHALILEYAIANEFERKLVGYATRAALDVGGVKHHLDAI